MVEIYCPIKKENIRFYLDKKLKMNLDRIKDKLKNKDKDMVIVFDGAEGAGKSTLAMQVCKYIDPTFDLDRICFSAKEFKKVIRKAKTNEAVLYDEAFTGLASASSLSQVTRTLVSLMMQIRQKNLFVGVALPSIFMLNKYVAMFRTKGLIHVFESKDRHLFFVFDRAKKKQLIIEGAKTFSYGKSIKKMKIFKGEFRGNYVVDEKQYRLKKMKALEDSEVQQGNLAEYDRNRLIYIIHKEYNLNGREVGELFIKYGFPLKQRQIERIILKIKKEEKEKEVDKDE